MLEPTPKHKKLYRTFVNKRNLALEKILNNTRLRITDQLNLCFAALVEIYAHTQSDDHARLVIHSTAQTIGQIVKRMRKIVHFLAYVSEGEILSQLSGKPPRAYEKPDLNEELFAGGSVEQRVEFYLSKIQDRMKQQARLASLTNERATYEDLVRVIPKKKRIAQKKVTLRKIGEARKPIDTPFLTDEQWQDVVDEYMLDYGIKNRGPDQFFDPEEIKYIRPDLEPTYKAPNGKDDAVYQWELEQDVTHDFVEQVRNGQVEAANANGYTDFVWVAIVDDRTDECCLWRDGLTTAEIDAELKGAHKDDECEGSVPPIHFNCRCTLEPVTDNIGELPETPIKDFDEWLDEKW